VRKKQLGNKKSRKAREIRSGRRMAKKM